MQTLRMKILKMLAVALTAGLVSGCGVFFAMAGEVNAYKAEAAEANRKRIEAENWIDVVAEQAQQQLCEMAKAYSRK